MRIANGPMYSLLLVAALCTGGRALAATQVFAPSDDTFINAGHADNNNGGSATIFTGTDGQSGVMRGLLRFQMPASLQARVTVTDVQLSLTVAALGNGTAGTPALESLRLLAQSWAEGNGVGDMMTTFVVGQACGGQIVGATWNRTNCAAGTSWTTAGGTVASTISAQASTAGIGAGGALVVSAGSNPALRTDVQAWIDSPASNAGWRLSSDSEGNPAAAQRFFSKEAGTAPGPQLTVTYSCKPGFVASGNDCVGLPTVPSGSARTAVLLAASLLMLGTRLARRHRAAV